MSRKTGVAKVRTIAVQSRRAVRHPTIATHLDIVVRNQLKHAVDQTFVLPAISRAVQALKMAFVTPASLA